MANKRTPWFSFFGDDWIAGTRTMSLAARGAYVDLLCHQFSHGSIPSEDRTICRILSAFPDEWAELKDEVLSKFTTAEDGTLVNERMSQERAHRAAIRDRAVRNGQNGGRPKGRQEPDSPHRGASKKPPDNPAGNPPETQRVTHPKPRGKPSEKAPTTTTTTTDSVGTSQAPTERHQNSQPTESRTRRPVSVGGSALAYEVGSGVSVEDLSNWILNQTYAGKPMKHADNGSRKMQLFELAQRFWSEMEATNWRIEKEPVGDPIAVFATRCYSQGLLRRTG